MIERHKLLYFFLCIVPFFNIIALHTNLVFVIALIVLFILLNLVTFKTKPVEKCYIYYLYAFFILIILLIISQLHSLLIINSSNIQAIRFFGMFLPISIFFIFIYDPVTITTRYLDRILVLYIIIFSFSIFIDYFILHSALDISLQPMYREEDRSYMSRPFGITGQPSVNSILLVFFYTFWFSLENKNVKIKSYLFILVTSGVFLQGSGSGFIAYIMLLLSMGKNINIYFKLLFLTTSVIGITWVFANFEFLNKISYEYLSGMVSVFNSQIQHWLDLIDKSFYSFFLFGGVSSKIDFGPLYLISNVGFIYFIFLISLFIYLILISQNHYERMSIYILLAGNLHYPVIFYMTMVFILPIFIFKVIANTDSKKEIHQSIASSI